MTPREGTAPSRFVARAGRHPKGGTATISPFGTIESSDEYVALLLQTVEETATDVGEDLRLTHGTGGRRREALQLVAFKLEQLRYHLATSRRRLNDLRTLRRMVEGGPSMDRERRERIELCA
jgi:hypothetical protein